MTSEQQVLVRQTLGDEGLVTFQTRFRGVQKDNRPHTRDYAQTKAERINRRFVRAYERMAVLRARIARNVMADGSIARPAAVWKMAVKVSEYRTTCAQLEQAAKAIIFK